MKNFIILYDYKPHTVVYFIRANSEFEALEKYLSENYGFEKLENGTWFVRDYGDEKYNKIYKDIFSLIKSEFLRYKNNRLEIKEIINFDPLSENLQEIFCSKEKI